MAALRRGLGELGYVEGKGFVLVPGWGDGRLNLLPELAKALVESGPDIILTDGSATARAARTATATIPIVMAGGNDPIQAGIAASLSQPGGNVTGFTTQAIDVAGKMLEILGLKLSYVVIESLEVEAIDAAVRQGVAVGQVAIMRGSPFLSSPQRKLIIERAAVHRLATMYETRDWVDLGGLVSYGSDFSELFRLAAGYIVKIINGAKPAELPFEQASKFELVINLKAAKAIGLDIPPIMLARADEVIE